jgi:putative membrane protein
VPPHYSGIDGFLNTRASLMLDVVSLAMLAVLPVLGFSILLVRCRRRYAIHKRIQLTLAAILLVTVVAFEIDMRWLTDWRERAKISPYFPDWVMRSLGIHLCFSVSTTFLWVFVVVQALRKIPDPPGPSTYSARHKFWARLAAADMLLTAVTGWIFYWFAFVAK